MHRRPVLLAISPRGVGFAVGVAFRCFTSTHAAHPLICSGSAVRYFPRNIVRVFGLRRVHQVPAEKPQGPVKSAKALVLNAGSSSLKFSVFNVDLRRKQDMAELNQPCGIQTANAMLLATGQVSDIGLESSTISYKAFIDDEQKFSTHIHVDDHKGAISEVLKLLRDPKLGVILDPAEIAVVGHRIVHGADKFNTATILTDDVIKAVEDASALAPLHNPPNLLGIRVAREIFKCPQVGVFDTAFHATIPPENYTYAIPLQLQREHHIRKYGFHGSSFCFVTGATAERLSMKRTEMNAIICHLGNGASMACIKQGRCIDTTMGLTPLEGLVMGTRSGDIDAGVVTHLINALGMSPKEVDTLLNKRSGLLGLTGHSNMQAVHAAADNGDADAALAEKIFVERIRKYIGSFLVKLEGELDALVFTAGVGENSERIRAMVCQGLGRLGMVLDTTKNTGASGVKEPAIISGVHSRTKILVVPTNEELGIAMQSVAAVGLIEPMLSPKEEAKLLMEAAKRRAEESVNGEEDEHMAMAVGGPKGVMIAASNRSEMTDSSIVEVGLMYGILPRVSKLGYFRPVAYHHADKRVNLMREVFGIGDDPETMYGVTVAQCSAMLAKKEDDKLMALILEKYQEYRQRHDFVVVSGLNQKELPQLGQDLNIRIADALNLPMVWSTDAGAFPSAGMTVSQSILSEISMSMLPGKQLKHVEVAASSSATSNVIGDEVQAQLKESKIDVIATQIDNRLRVRTLREVANVLGADVLTGHDALDTHHVGRLVVATMQVPDLLKYILAKSVEEDGGHQKVTRNQIQELKAEFKKFDKEHNGKILLEEVGTLMRVIGREMTDFEEQSVMAELDKDGTGKITFQEFLLLLSRRQEEPIPGSAPLVVTHISRIDVLLSLLMASRSQAFPKIAGVLLTGGSKETLPESVHAILAGLDVVGTPVLIIPLDTFAATQRIHGLHGLAPRLLPTAKVKLQAAQELFSMFSSSDFMERLVGGSSRRRDMTSHLFQHHIFLAARRQKQRIVLPEGDDWRVLVAAGELLARDLCDLIILGDRQRVLSLAKKYHADLSKATILDVKGMSWVEKDVMVETLLKLRGTKGMTREKALDIIDQDANYFGTLMMYLHRADGMVSGACHTTADTMRPAMQIIKTEPGASLVSSVFFMLLPERVYVFGDCAINVDPSAEDLAQIAASSAATAKAFGISPRVAMLSYATGQSNTGPIVDKVRKATELVQDLITDPEIAIEGPMQFDAAVDPEVAAVKVKGGASKVAGQATVVIFPDLNTGNNTYKAVQQSTRCVAIGPIMQGLRMPVNDLSRGCTVDDIVNTVVITCIQASTAKARDVTPPQ
eukprot:CAMPEP_0177719356 /NCGR_PEP_ID=MMETSP0484_2-20121128/16059_1 /TAXON_ID=354590 /ORGANISM="Rhodomonas lens, Strain RHODO" /LENGTH=1342 /DNA_ID=CAMNT_0019231567 /DNA_START=67 /DNA_END=4096 /DNA_ORIENTATION=+